MRDHLFRCGLHTEEGALQVDGNDVVKILLGNLEQILITRDAGIVDHDVDPTELLCRGRYETIDIGTFCHIGRNHAYIIGPDQFGCRPGQAIGIDVRNNNLCALLEESFSAGSADTARRTGDDGDLAG